MPRTTAIRLGAPALCALLACPVFAAPPPARTAAQLSSRLLGELDDARALSDLVRLSEAAEREGDLKLLAATLDSVRQAKKARPDVRAQAQSILASVREAQGQLVQARGIADELGVIRAWSILGPFDNDGRRGHEAVFGPESDGVVFGKAYPGKEHEVSWRVLPDIAPLGLVELTHAVSPRQDVTVYAATTLSSAKARGVILHLGASGATKVWLNGALVHEDQNQHPARFDQSALPVRLLAGENKLLIKLSHGSGQLALVLRVAGEKDEPLPDLGKSARAPAVTSAGFAPGSGAEGKSIAGESKKKASQPPLPKAPDAVAELTARAAKNPKDARAQEDLAVLLAARRPDDDTERLALHAQEKAAEAAPGDPQIELRLSWLETRDQNKKRQALERAQAAHPRDAEVLEALCQHRLERGESWKALALAEQAQAGGVTAQLTLARAQDAAGLAGRASALRREIARKNPDDPRALKAAAGAERRMGHGPEAKRLLEQALKLRFDDADARSELVSLLLDQGDVDGALARMAEGVALNPALLGQRVRAAELLSQNGRIAEGERAYAEVLQLSPDDPELHEALGRHRLRTGDTEGALASFARALELRPQNPSLRELVRSVRPEERYAAPYLYDAQAAARTAAQTKGAEGEDLEVLSDLTVVKVFPNGLSSRTHQLILRVLTQRGVDQARVQSLQFAPDRQEVHIERARVVRPDGTVIEAKGESERSLSEPWYGIWYDVRARVVPFTQLAPGDVLEFQARIDDAGTNFFSDYFGDFELLQGTSRKRVADYVLLGPPGRVFYTNHAALPNLTQREEKLPDGGTLLRFTATDVARVVPEPGMPGASEAFAWLHVSTFKDWDSVGRFYWGLVKDQLEVTPDLRKAAAEAVKDVPESDELGRIRAVYHYVLAKTRYVGLEFGINSFKPYAVDTILSRGFGDCKDKASSMYTLLKALGIDSRVVLLRTRPQGALEDAPASLAVFNHAILYVPKYQLFLDGTAEFHGSKELPRDDHRAEALIVEPSGQGSKLLRTPEESPKETTDRTAAQIDLAADGSARMVLVTKSQGAMTPELRRTFESPDERKARAEDWLSRGSYPAVKVTSVEASDPLALEQPFELKFTARLPSFAAPGLKGSLRFTPFGKRARLVESWAQLSKRTLPLRLPLARTSVVESRVALPPGLTAALPEGAAAKGPFGSFTLRYAMDGSTVVATLEQEFVGGQIGPEAYPAYRAFLESLDAAVARPIEAVAAGGGM